MANLSRPLPQNIEAEQAVLGAVLIDGDLINQSSIY
jgi:replicative DNA helicase